MPDVASQLSPEQLIQIAAFINQQQGGPSTDGGPNKRPREYTNHRRPSVLLSGPVWEALRKDCREHLQFIEDEFFANGMKIPFELLDLPAGSDERRLPKVVVNSRRHLPIGMDGRITPGMAGLKAVYGEAVAYSETIRVARHDHRGALEKLIKELEALDKADKLEPSVKQLLPPARAAFDNVDSVMDAEMYMRHVRYPPISKPPESAD